MGPFGSHVGDVGSGQRSPGGSGGAGPGSGSGVVLQIVMDTASAAQRAGIRMAATTTPARVVSSRGAPH